MAMAGPVSQAVSNSPQSPNPPKTPPPIQGTTQYFLAVKDKQKGPFDMSNLSSQVASGILTKQTLVWTEGMEKWEPAGQLPELERLFAGTPPPLPAA